jgi:hypothetical protein
VTVCQKIKYIFIKLRYLLYQQGQNYNIRLDQYLSIVTLGGEKIQGKIKFIDKIESDGEFIANVYEIQGESNNYMIDDCHVLCVFDIK